MLLTFLITQGKFNFKNLARWVEYEEKTLRRNYEKTLRRNYEKTLNLCQFTQILIETYEQGEEFIACIDASFIPKNGKKT